MRWWSDFLTLLGLCLKLSGTLLCMALVIVVIAGVLWSVFLAR